MKFGIIPVNVGVSSADQVIALAQRAERCGLESVWTFEHIIVPLTYDSKYPYHPSGRLAAQPETNFVDPLIALTAVAMHTKTIRLGTGVNIVAQTNPLTLAKQCASLDFMSNGRFMLGAGIGWLREEFRAMGTPFERRGARFDDTMVALRKAWSGEVVEHRSDFIDWTNFKSYPLPVQRPGVPVIMGGGTSRIYERVAKYGDGWFIPPTGDWSVNNEAGSGLTVALERLAEACRAEGRDPSEIELTTFWNPAAGPDSLKRLEDHGIDRVVTVLAMLGKDPMEGIARMAETYVR